MRKAFSLVELLVVMVVFAAVSVALAALFSTFLTDIPKSYSVVQENTSLLSMLGQMRKDIDRAKALPRSSAGRTTDDELLLIELPDRVICYQLKNGEVLRRRLTDARQDAGEDTKVWSVPHTKVEWQLAGGDDKAYAVEVKTHIEYELRGHRQNKMANSYLYFVGALLEAEN
ncbi:MAG: prepilin-type N-terminal cleavage/methylation domain-containing protein [Planctomycetota bacterium]|jgi:prepilin-type N-terminal cleavage/methylation domain-containing protein